MHPVNCGPVNPSRGIDPAGGMTGDERRMLA